jgi:hypothetical protein
MFAEGSLQYRVVGFVTAFGEADMDACTHHKPPYSDGLTRERTIRSRDAQAQSLINGAGDRQPLSAESFFDHG